MKIGALLVALAAFLVPETANAATDIECIGTKAGPEAVSRIGNRVIEAGDKGSSLDSSLDLDRETVIAARNACRLSNKWSNDATDLAMSWFRARATKGGAERAATADGLSPQRIAAAYAALSSDDRSSLQNGQKPSQATINSIVATADAARPSAAVRMRVIRHVAILYSALAALEYYPAEFDKL